MKFFIVAALLVAAVAGQSTMDVLKLNKDLTSTRSMLKFDRPVQQYYPGMVRDFDMKDKMDNYFNKYTTVGDFDYDTTTTVYTIDEIMSHPLFREYMNLPIFRQFWEYPVFQKYVASIYFQRFWTIPQFQQYFINYTLFKTYIFPIVQLFKYEQTTMNTFPFAYNNYNTEYYGQQYDMMTKYNIPTVCQQYNQVYCKALLEKMYNHLYYTMMMPNYYYGQQQEETMPMEYPTTTTDMYTPYVNRMINQQGYYNRYPTYQTEKMMTPYMERMYNNVHFNKDMYMNTYESTPKMVDDVVIPTTYNHQTRYENIRPIFNHFNKMIKA